MRNYAETCRRARSSDPWVAFQALQRLGRAYSITPTTDTGYKLYGPGRLFLPAATNLCTDPQGALADGTFWPADTANTNTTANQPLPVPLPSEPTITKCLKLVNDGTADAPVTANLTVLASTAHNSSLYVFAPILGGNLTISVENGHTFSLAALTAANAGWVHYSVQSNTVVGEVVLGLKFAFAGGTPSTVYVTGFCPVASSVLTPYGDGSYPGWAWTGTAHASTSTRTVSSLYYTTWPYATIGTIAMRVVPLGAGNDGVRIRLLTLNDAALTTSRMYLEKLATNAWAARKVGTDSNFNEVQSAGLSYVAGSTHVLVQRSEATVGHSDLNYDGTDAGHVSGFDLPLEATTNCRLIIGGNGGALQANAYIGPVIVAPANAAAAYVTAQQGNSGALYADVMGCVELARRYNLQPFLTLPLQSDSVGWVVTE